MVNVLNVSRDIILTVESVLSMLLIQSLITAYNTDTLTHTKSGTVNGKVDVKRSVKFVIVTIILPVTIHALHYLNAVNLLTCMENVSNVLKVIIWKKVSVLLMKKIIVSNMDGLMLLKNGI